MPERKSNQVARIVAIAGLVALFLLVGITVATSGGGGNGGNGGEDREQPDKRGPTAKGRKAVEAGVWVVREGDTLTKISQQTGIEIDELIEINPDADPQALISGQRIALR